MTSPAGPQPAGSSAPRVLLVARRFAPHSDPTSYRWLRFVTGLVRRGWHVEVLTVVAEPSLEYYDEGLLAQLPDGLVVHRVNPGPVEKAVLRAKLRKAGAASAAASGAAPARRPSRGPSWLLREIARRGYEGMIPLVSPDPTVEWIPWAVRRGTSLLRERPFDLLVSSSSPFSSHIVGRTLAKKSGLPWVGDFSDPLADNVFIRRPKWRLERERRLERDWITAMAGVIVPVPEMADLFLSRYSPRDSATVHLVPYGYPEELYDSVQPWSLEGFTLVHTGVFYPDFRDPMPLFEALGLTREVPLKLHHAGGMSDTYREFLKQEGTADRFEYHGYLPRRDVAALQRGGSCLLAIGNKGGLQLPGKLLDYFGARRPILMLKNDAHDIAADLVESTGTGLVVENRAESIAAGIRRLHDWWRDGSLDGRFKLGAGGEYSWSHQEEKLAEALSRHVRPAGA